MQGKTSQKTTGAANRLAMVRCRVAAQSPRAWHGRDIVGWKYGHTSCEANSVNGSGRLDARPDRASHPGQLNTTCITES